MVREPSRIHIDLLGRASRHHREWDLLANDIRTHEIYEKKYDHQDLYGEEYENQLELQLLGLVPELVHSSVSAERTKEGGRQPELNIE